MENLKIQTAEEKDWPYIKEKLENYLLDADNAEWRQFYVVRLGSKTVAFARIIDRGDHLELASLGVDYYHRKKGIGIMLLKFIIEKARELDSSKPIYGVTHRPGFLLKVGFQEASSAPRVLEEKRRTKCKDPSKVKIMIYPF